VLAAVDPLATSGGCDDLVMQLASSLASREGAELEVVHAWRLEGESMLRHGRLRLPKAELENLLQTTEDEHRAALAGLLDPYGLAADGHAVHLLKDDPAAAIRRVAERLEADVIVMGTVGRSRIPGFFIGNTAEEVLQTTTASVLAVKPAGFVTPVA
jgi:nucleotide-binding universal stress UspA family protein